MKQIEKDGSDEAISTAEKEIAKILEKLESDTDMVLDKIEVIDVNMIRVGDDREQWLRRVVVGMKRRPGTRWGQ